MTWAAVGSYGRRAIITHDDGTWSFIAHAAAWFLDGAAHRHDGWSAAAFTLLPAFAVMQLFLELPIAIGGALSLAIALWATPEPACPQRLD